MGRCFHQYWEACMDFCYKQSWAISFSILNVFSLMFFWRHSIHIVKNWQGPLTTWTFVECLLVIAIGKEYGMEALTTTSFCPKLICQCNSSWTRVNFLSTVITCFWEGTSTVYVGVVTGAGKEMWSIVNMAFLFWTKAPWILAECRECLFRWCMGLVCTGRSC